MRTLLTLGTLATALLVPWNSLVDSWVTHTSTAAADGETDQDFGGPAARLDAQLGILPLASEAGGPADEPIESNASPPTDGRKRLNLAELFATPGAKESLSATDSAPGLICENGVCRVPDAGTSPHATQNHTAADMTWEHARLQLEELGVTQFRLERLGDDEGYRFSCALPVSVGSRASRRFEATADNDLAAVVQVLNDIASWRGSEAGDLQAEPAPDDETIGPPPAPRPPDVSGL